MMRQDLHPPTPIDADHYRLVCCIPDTNLAVVEIIQATAKKEKPLDNMGPLKPETTANAKDEIFDKIQWLENDDKTGWVKTADYPEQTAALNSPSRKQRCVIRKYQGHTVTITCSLDGKYLRRKPLHDEKPTEEF